MGQKHALKYPLEPTFTDFDCDLPTPPAPPCTPEEYDAWFRAAVQEALDESDELSCSHEEVMAETQAIIDRTRSAPPPPLQK